MTDWADEIVEKCRWMQGSLGALEMARQLRAAELRGRVKGMREAAEIAKEWGVSILQLGTTENLHEVVEEMLNDIGPNISHAIRADATKLESNPTE